eukprot:34592-Pleurochrysis_carterae.AAC.1
MKKLSSQASRQGDYEEQDSGKNGANQKLQTDHDNQMCGALTWLNSAQPVYLQSRTQDKHFNSDVSSFLGALVSRLYLRKVHATCLQTVDVTFSASECEAHLRKRR